MSRNTATSDMPQVTPKLFEQGKKIRPIVMHECSNIVLIESDPSKVALPVERGEGVEFEREESLDGGTRDVPLPKGLAGRIATLDHRKEWIVCQEKGNL